MLSEWGPTSALIYSLIATGHNLDLGAAQLNWSSGHLQRRGLPLSAAFDPCTGLRVGGEVLANCYRRTSGSDEQASQGVVPFRVEVRRCIFELTVNGAAITRRPILRELRLRDGFRALPQGVSCR